MSRDKMLDQRRPAISSPKCSLGLGLLWITPAYAHQVEIAGDVGGTLHIEPNDTPRAGEPSLAWFALTQLGGKQIPLTECQCQLAVYAQPAGATPIQEPVLTAVDAEGYQGVPGAEIVFPQVGGYELVLRGEPNTPDAFQSFELRFEVTVATGQAITQTPDSVLPSPNSPTAITSEPQPPSVESDQGADRGAGFGWLGLLIAVGVITVGVVWWKRSGKR